MVCGIQLKVYFFKDLSQPVIKNQVTHIWGSRDWELHLPPTHHGQQWEREGASEVAKESSSNSEDNDITELAPPLPGPG